MISEWVVPVWVNQPGITKNRQHDGSLAGRITRAMEGVHTSLTDMKQVGLDPGNVKPGGERMRRIRIQAQWVALLTVVDHVEP